MLIFTQVVYRKEECSWRSRSHLLLTFLLDVSHVGYIRERAESVQSNVCETGRLDEDGKPSESSRAFQRRSKNLLLYLLYEKWWNWSQPHRRECCRILRHGLEPCDGQISLRSMPSNRTDEECTHLSTYFGIHDRGEYTSQEYSEEET